MSVALRKESVDRNPNHQKPLPFRPQSLSARRAWIEILLIKVDYQNLFVALRKESVDRNRSSLISVEFVEVALRKESVDRNTQTERKQTVSVSRSPQGERG